MNGCWRGSSACSHPATHQSFPLLLEIYCQSVSKEKKTCQACFPHLHMSPHLQLLVCRTYPRVPVCFDFPLLFLLAGSSGPTAHSSALLLSNGLDGCVHKPDLVLETGSARALDIGPLTFPMALLILKYSSPHPTGKAGSCRGAILCI